MAKKYCPVEHRDVDPYHDCDGMCPEFRKCDATKDCRIHARGVERDKTWKEKGK